MRTYTPTIGLEIHAELNTRSKMFCGCKNDSSEVRPNVNICPVCMAHPGTLPVINREAVQRVLSIGKALGARLAENAHFDRKNYFYPDIPKGYQISQYEEPLVLGGELADVAITRVHLEEDTARSSHQTDASFVDFNRAGVPLMEMVTEPVIHSAKQAGLFARELQLLLRALNASNAHMEKGEMRVEANISVSATAALGTKVEVKNLNSFRSVERAIAYEIERQTKAIETGTKVIQETRGWDEQKQRSFSQRKKESSHDYRYFPEPDLLPLVRSGVVQFSDEALGKDMPELPQNRRKRYLQAGVSHEQADLFVADERLSTLFEATLRLKPNSAKSIANYISSDIAGLISKYGPTGLTHITPEGLAFIIDHLTRGTLSSRGAKSSIAGAFVEGADIQQESKKYIQQSNEHTLTELAQTVIDENPAVAAEVRRGKTEALQFLVGQGMKLSTGSANPQVLRELFKTLLG